MFSECWSFSLEMKITYIEESKIQMLVRFSHSNGWKYFYIWEALVKVMDNSARQENL